MIMIMKNKRNHIMEDSSLNIQIITSLQFVILASIFILYSHVTLFFPICGETTVVARHDSHLKKQNSGIQNKRTY